MLKRLKKQWKRHWNCFPWFVCGMTILIKGEIGRFSYALTWITVLVLIWWKLPTVGLDEFEKEMEDTENE